MAKIPQRKIDRKKVQVICESLSHFLADTFVIYVKTLNFHWNMVGSEFYMYHKFLEEQYEELQEASDSLAERLRMLHFKAPATLKEFLELSCVSEPKGALTQEKMIRELASDHEMMVEHAGSIIDYCDEAFDQGTSDLLIERKRAHDKFAWMLRSHFLQK